MPDELLSFAYSKHEVPREILGEKLLEHESFSCEMLIAIPIIAVLGKFIHLEDFQYFTSPKDIVFFPTGTCFRAIWKTNFA